MTASDSSAPARAVSRRSLLAGLLGATALTLSGRALAAPPPVTPGAAADAAPAAATAPTGAPFSYDWLVSEARRLAGESYQSGDGALPKVLADLSYDQYRDIRYRGDHALWRDVSPYEVQFFHLGAYYDRPVAVFDVEGGVARPVTYRPADFDLGRNRFAEPLPDDLGFAGVRVHYPLNDPEVLDELLVFLGASYFRALGRGTRYGISSRAVAVDTGLPKGEEFPAFTRLYLERPAERGSPLMVHALLDGPSLTGAYRFAVQPGETTAVDVTARLFFRTDVERLGLAPLTSMFDHGPSDPADHPDYRPRVHDSQGLLLHSGTGEWIWRPLRNPRALALSAFQETAPKGFGLLQRVREFDAYEDLEARYDLRPSLWIEPKGDWGEGAVTLLEIPTPDETHDNIVAFWQPKAPAKAGGEAVLRYVMHWGLAGPQQPLARAVETRLGRGGLPGQQEEAETKRKVVVDFVGGPLPDLPPDADVVPVLEANGIEAGEIVAHPNPVTGGLRVFFDLPVPTEDTTAELRCRLTLDGRPISETWSFQWSSI
ncbi:glucan biosynthesis protein [Caenispirillum bisanense]|uniref:Glucans biosynthesis protein G n=1 Tax=Caenispirillum bisanense TaxID=414052 RepID=A0A286H328_9PROT|nr:glucan biosynthesis protein [Caenispirillum bisanense]SOE01729.1 glucans biosynthesis protein [Caenispirillum bisanense]